MTDFNNDADYLKKIWVEFWLGAQGRESKSQVKGNQVKKWE